MSVLPLLATAAFTIHLLFERKFLRSTRIPLGTFLTQGSVALFLYSLLFLVVAKQPVALVGFDRAALGLLGILALLSVARNLSFYHGFRGETLTKVDLFLILEPLVVIAVAALVFPGERDPAVLLAAVIGFLAFLFGHLHHRHLSFDRYERSLAFYVLLTGMEAVVIKGLFEYLSPAAIYTIRVAAISLLFVGYFGRRTLSIHPLTWKIFLVMVTSFIGYVTLYYSYAAIGVTVTSIVFLLYPVALFFLARELFHERQPAKMAIAGAVILAVVAYTLVVQSMP